MNNKKATLSIVSDTYKPVDYQGSANHDNLDITSDCTDGSITDLDEINNLRTLISMKDSRLKILEAHLRSMETIVENQDNRLNDLMVDVASILETMQEISDRIDVGS